MSVATKKLLDILRDSSMNAMRVTDEEITVIDTQTLSDEKMIGTSSRKTPR
jgi:hypothetical protein